MSKASKYNYFIRWKDGNYYGYNFLYRSMIKIPDSAYSDVVQLLNDPDSLFQASEEDSEVSQWFQALQSCRFIVENDTSEISLIKHFYYKSLYASDSLNLIILPTLHCNLDCPYCYEYKKPIYMESNIENDLMKWMEKFFSSKRNVHIAWFGGEPLLGLDTIYRLTNQIKQFCENIHAHYNASMTTNGVLINSEFLSKIQTLSIRHIQVTFDGNKFHHNQMRKTPDGHGSFEQIIENTIAFCSSIPADQCKLSIRVNCTDANFESIDELMSTIPAVVRARATIFFRWVYDTKASSERGYKDFSPKMQGRDSFAGIRTLNAKAREMGFRTIDPFLSKGFNFCEADFRDQFIIYPNGNVFLCTHTGNEEEKLFNISECISSDGFGSKALSYHSRWMTVNPFDNKACLACNLLPLCLGGCRKSQFEGNSNCLTGKSTVPFLIENAVSQKIATRAVQTSSLLT